VPDEKGFTYSLQNSNNFVQYNMTGYYSIENSESFSIKIKGPDGTSAVNMSEYSATCTINNESPVSMNMDDEGVAIPANTFTDLTGIVLISVTNGERNAMIHLMLVGPAVHAGLTPGVVSA